MKYKLISVEHWSKLNDEVQKHLDDGWTLYGVPYLGSSVNYGNYHHQAMILRETDTFKELIEG